MGACGQNFVRGFTFRVDIVFTKFYGGLWARVWVQGAGLAGLWASSQSLGLMCSRRCMGACELEFGLQGAGLEGLWASSQGV